jgi:hypothetical protein
MGTPLPPGFWDEYRKRYEDEIAYWGTELRRFESGELRILGKGGDESPQWIAHIRETIQRFQRIVDAVKRGELP